MAERVPETVVERAADRLIEHLAAQVRPWLIRELRQVLDPLDGEAMPEDTDEIERAAAAWTASYRARQRQATRTRRPGKRNSG
ncbi:MAG: hypothetical protein U1A78_03645 [Polyangia bacterium]